MNIRRFCMTMAIVLTGLCIVNCGGGDDVTPTPVNGGGNNGNGGANTSQGTMQLTRTCSTCSGSKLCVDCNGTGKGCKTCGGTGNYCKGCGSTGECGYCYGSGVCQRCNGKKGEECIKCGWRHGKCQQCGGSGMSLGIKCKACGGSGICDKCRGNWWTECSSCSGSGDCSYCRGNKICQTCKGNPTCKTCGGDGHCTTCNNSDGQCKDCNGSGETNLTSFSFTESGGNEKIFIHSTSAWTVSSDADWIKFSLTSGSGDNTITVTAAKNSTATTRSGIITLTYGNSKVNINVAQQGEPPVVTVQQSTLTLDDNGSAQTISITSNTTWSIKTSDSWLTCTPSSGSGDATVSISASAYTLGARYATLTITDTTGEVSTEISVVQAASTDALTTLKNWLEKPMGVVDVNLRTASYQTIRNEIAESYVIDEKEFEGDPYFYVWVSDNEACRNMTYQGLSFWCMSVWKVTYSKSYSKSVNYSFRIDESEMLYDYKTYLNNIIQDFKYSLNVTLEQTQSSDNYVTYSGLDANNKRYDVQVETPTNGDHTYAFKISARY